MIFNLPIKGKIHQKFLENANSLYKDQGLIGHTGVDWGFGYGTPIFADNAGYVYKVYREGDLQSNWCAVYMIVEDKMEVCYGHLSRIDVLEGDTVKAGQQIGLEGNKGDVFYGGQRITATMQRAGDTRGSHVHESWRPVRKVKGTVMGEHYLQARNGLKFKKDGYIYEIELDNPQTRGTVDPLLYSKQGLQGQLESNQKTLISTLFALLAKLKQ